MLKSGIPYNLISRQSTRKLTTRILSILVDRNISFYICMSEEATYHIPVASAIQPRLMKKVNEKS